MKNNLKKMAGYYKPYMGTFLTDMFFGIDYMIHKYLSEQL